LKKESKVCILFTLN